MTWFDDRGEGRIERQEIYCHECSSYVQFDIDLAVNGEYLLECPVCSHDHCRFVTDGKVTDRRWGDRNPYPVIKVDNNITHSSDGQSSSTSGGFITIQILRPQRTSEDRIIKGR